MKYLSPDQYAQIYGLSSSEDGVIRYIGKTVQTLKARLSEHLYDARHPEYSLSPDTHKGRWIREVEEKGFCIQVHLIEETTVAEQDEREKYWIRHYGRANLTNNTDGGETVHTVKNRNPTFSFERIRACLKKNLKKNLLDAVENIHRTIYGTYSLQDVLDDEFRRNVCKAHRISLDANITVAEFIAVMNDVINNDVQEYINNLKKIYNTKCGREVVEWGYQERLLQRARYIPKTSTKLDDMLFELFEEKEYGIYRYDD